MSGHPNVCDVNISVPCYLKRFCVKMQTERAKNSSVFGEIHLRTVLQQLDDMNEIALIVCALRMKLDPGEVQLSFT